MTCDCPKGYFTFHDKSRCQILPMLIGDFCDEDDQCSDEVPHSFCSWNHRCVCSFFFYSNNAGTQCTAYPLTVGDACPSQHHCFLIPNSDCIYGNCTCFYGYKASDDNNACVERPHVYPYIPPSVIRPPTCDAQYNIGCANNNNSNTWCVRNGTDVATCQCIPGYSYNLSRPDHFCFEAKAFSLSFNLSHIQW